MVNEIGKINADDLPEQIKKLADNGFDSAMVTNIERADVEEQGTVYTVFLVGVKSE